MNKIDLTYSRWRADFPAFQQFEKQGLVWLDSAATTQKPNLVIDTLTQYYQSGCSNIHRAQHPLAQTITAAFEKSRQLVASFLNAKTDDQIIFTRSTTEAINLLAYSLENILPCTGNIIISALEHHANLLPWQQLAKRKGLSLQVLPITDEGLIDLVIAKQMINQETRLLAVSQMSNVFGSTQPIKELIQYAKTYQAITVIDGAQGVVHECTDVQLLDCDFYSFSGHKLYAPEGVGILYGKPGQLAKLTPWQFGGEMVQTASYQTANFLPAPLGFEAGTPAIGAVLGLASAINYLTMQDRAMLYNYEVELTKYLIKGLKQRRAINILGSPKHCLVSFYLKDVHPADLSQLLTEQNIAVRTGQHCCMPLYNSLGLKGSTRISLAFYNNSHDIDYFLTALDKAIELLS